ncbi:MULTISPECIES: DUF4145 domain-containing protein [Bacillaceae]|uniref:DUF4145 domain-containing protein n=1 Tax=Bacillaceae TaxID=186817 RepID=UPI00066085DC|nr:MULTISPECIES: DUF4145 domain-containing protein [Bacillaceae]MCF7622527.1 DUF4145 domain-containing protein [Peribacillus frigoritolerans]PRA80895.1 DUF4145 domain-containing protein [Peribacillus simplex]
MKVYCNKCKQKTKHNIVKEFIREYTPDNTPEMQIDYAKGEWKIIECMGCEQISFYEVWVNSEDIDYNSGNLEETIRIFPNRETDFKQTNNYFVLPSKIKNIYKEIIETYNQNLLLSCSACLRAIIEAICSNVGIQGRNIEKKINGLHEREYLTKRHADILHEHRFLGNKALHELQIPTKQELEIAIQIVEHTLENIYELQDKVEELKWLKERRNMRKET